MSSSNRHWESCPSEMTNTPITPPPKYSSFQMADNIGTESINTLQQESLQSENQIDLENGQSATPGSSWHGEDFHPSQEALQSNTSQEDSQPHHTRKYWQMHWNSYSCLSRPQWCCCRRGFSVRFGRLCGGKPRQSLQYDWLEEDICAAL